MAVILSDLAKAVKAALLVTTDDDLVNTELQALADAAVADLRTAGITQPKAADTSDDTTQAETEENNGALFERAVILFSKANFLDDDTAARRAAGAYTAIKTAMSLDDNFREGV